MELGAAAAARAPAQAIQQLSLILRTESLARSTVSISSWSSSPLSSRPFFSSRRSSGSSSSCHDFSDDSSLSPRLRRNLAISKLNDGRRGRVGRWCPSPLRCSKSGIAESAPVESISRDDSSGEIKSRPSRPVVLDNHDQLDSAGEAGGGGDLLEVEEGELDVYAAAVLLDGIEQKLQELEREEGKHDDTPTQLDHLEDQQHPTPPASLLVGEGEASKSLFDQMREIFVFAGPALGIWVSGPLMSIIDTAVIGNSSTLELAALGPGTVLCDQTSYVFMFLSIATSNLIATALAHKNEAEAAGHLSRLLFVSLVSGVGMLLILEFFATPLLQAFVGVKNYSLVPAGRLYVQIRALAWPVVLMGMVAQSASLGMQDSWAPLKVLAIASLINLFGDILLCTVLGYGIGGAAWATTVSQFVGGFLMLKAIGDKGYNPLAISVPNLAELMTMFHIAGPVLLTMLSKVAFYTLITFLATSLGATTLGAHQVMIGVFSLCTVWGEPLCQTAQSFMPTLMYGSGKNLKQARSLLHTLIIIGVCLGTTLGFIAASVPWFFPQIFTNDPAIISQDAVRQAYSCTPAMSGGFLLSKVNLSKEELVLGGIISSIFWFQGGSHPGTLKIAMRAVTLPFLLSIMLTPPTLSCEGTLLAGRDLKFLGFSMASCFCGGTVLLLMLHRLGVGLIGSWWTLVAFQSTRFIQSYSRLAGPKSVFAEEESSSVGKEASIRLA